MRDFTVTSLFHFRDRTRCISLHLNLRKFFFQILLHVSKIA